MEHKLMPPRYAETIMLDAQNGQLPALSDVELLASSYLAALEMIAAPTDDQLDRWARELEHPTHDPSDPREYALRTIRHGLGYLLFVAENLVIAGHGIEARQLGDLYDELLASYAKYRAQQDADAAKPTHIRKKAGPNYGNQYYSHAHHTQFMDGYVDPMSQTLCGAEASGHDMTWAETRYVKNRSYVTCQACNEARLRDPKAVK